MNNKQQNNLDNRRNCTFTEDETYKGKAINTDGDEGNICIEEILNPLNAHLDDMIAKHSQVTVTRFDLRSPDDGTEDLTPKQVGRIFENIKRNIHKTEYAGRHNPDLRLIGVPENHGNGTHYHCVALTNGNAIQNPYTIFDNAEKYLALSLGKEEEDIQGLVDHCDKHGENGIKIRRGSPDEEERTNAVMHQISYMAKERGKESLPKGQHLWIGTRVPKNNNDK